MLKSAFFSLLALCLCLSVYGSNVQCPHGCGDPNTDKRIFQIENTIRSCFEQLAAISESNYEKFLDNDTRLYRAYFTPRFESEHSVATLSLDRRGR